MAKSKIVGTGVTIIGSVVGVLTLLFLFTTSGISSQITMDEKYATDESVKEVKVQCEKMVDNVSVRQEKALKEIKDDVKTMKEVQKIQNNKNDAILDVLLYTDKLPREAKKRIIDIKEKYRD